MNQAYLFPLKKYQVLSNINFTTKEGLKNIFSNRINYLKFCIIMQDFWASLCDR